MPSTRCPVGQDLPELSQRSGKISLGTHGIGDVVAGGCHPPAAWDQVEGFSAMSMGPPGRQ